MATVAPHQLQVSFHCLSVIKESGPHPSRVQWLLRASPEAEWGREGSEGGVEAAEEREMRGELTLDVWLENKKIVQSPGAEASLPICLPLGRLCPTLFLGLWPALCKV